MLIKNRMHPKNIYNSPPNLKELAINYPDFRNYVKQDLSGKVTIDYQDPKALRELTRTLLKKDFDLDVEIDETRLIPRVPLCLNYILWIEDLLELAQLSKSPLGIDIGTGCVSIYCLLGARKNWKMLGTEVDADSYEKAKENVARNNLQSEISVKLVSDSKQLLIGVIDETEYDFCMCNPPFFDTNEKPKNRTSRRPQLESVASQVTSEISCEGGEVSFIKKLIEESVILKDQIKIYTTLLGKKSDFVYIKKELQKVCPKSVAFTEFGQGRTIRWGAAWTFGNYNFKMKPEKKVKPKAPLQFILPGNKTESSVFEEVKKVLSDLKINFEEEVCDGQFILSCKAYENTWSHQRRKKRLKARSNEQNSEETPSNVESEMDEGGPSTKKIKLSEEPTDFDGKAAIVEGLISLKSLDSSVILEMSCTEGDKESLHQIYQYLKNYFSKGDT